MGAQVWFVRCDKCGIAFIFYSFHEALNCEANAECPTCKEKGILDLVDVNATEIG